MSTTPDFFCEPNISIYCDGSVHDEPQQRGADERIRRQLKEAGYRVVVIRYDGGLAEQVGTYQDIFGEASA